MRSVIHIFTVVYFTRRVLIYKSHISVVDPGKTINPVFDGCQIPRSLFGQTYDTPNALPGTFSSNARLFVVGCPFLKLI